MTQMQLMGQGLFTLVISIRQAILQPYSLQSTIDQYASLCNEMFHNAFGDLQTHQENDEFSLEEGNIEWLIEALGQVECSGAAT